MQKKGRSLFRSEILFTKTKQTFFLPLSIFLFPVYPHFYRTLCFKFFFNFFSLKCHLHKLMSNCLIFRRLNVKQENKNKRSKVSEAVCCGKVNRALLAAKISTTLFWNIWVALPPCAHTIQIRQREIERYKSDREKERERESYKERKGQGEKNW